MWSISYTLKSERRFLEMWLLCLMHFTRLSKKKDWLSYRTICKKPYISSLISTCLNLIKSCCHYSLCHWNFSFLCKYWSIYHPVFTAKILKKCTKNSPYIYYKNIYSIIKSFSYSKLSTISENSISILTLLWSTPFMFLLAPWILTSDVWFWINKMNVEI